MSFRGQAEAEQAKRRQLEEQLELAQEKIARLEGRDPSFVREPGPGTKPKEGLWSSFLRPAGPARIAREHRIERALSEHDFLVFTNAASELLTPKRGGAGARIERAGDSARVSFGTVVFSLASEGDSAVLRFQHDGFFAEKTRWIALVLCALPFALAIGLPSDIPEIRLAVLATMGVMGAFFAILVATLHRSKRRLRAQLSAGFESLVEALETPTNVRVKTERSEEVVETVSSSREPSDSAHVLVDP